MKKIFIIMVGVLLLPMAVYAAPEDVENRRSEYQEKREEMIEQKAEVKALIQTKAEIRVQTKEQIRASRQEVRALKNQLVASFQTMKDLTAEEREELLEDIDGLRAEIKDLHSTDLALRDAYRDEILSINDQITSIVSNSGLDEEEEATIETIMEQL